VPDTLAIVHQGEMVTCAVSKVVRGSDLAGAKSNEDRRGHSLY